jgi:hypothetical protein
MRVDYIQPLRFFFLKKNFFAGCLPDRALGKENTKKNKKKLFAGCLEERHSAKKIWKKIKKSLPGASDMAPGKEIIKKKLKKSLPGVSR